MTQHPEPVPAVDPTDELASALLDGEATVEEHARATEPAVAARVDALAAVARLVAAPVEPAADASRELAIAAALAAFDAPAVDEDDSTPRDELSVRRDRSRRTFRIVSAVAAAAVVLVGVGALLTRAGNVDQTQAAAVAPPSAADSADTTTGAAAGGSGTASETQVETGTATAPDAASEFASVLEDLGSYDDLDGLAVVLRDRFGTAGTDASDAGDSAGAGSAPPTTIAAALPAPGTARTTACLTTVPTADGETVVAVATATVAGAPAEIVVLEAGDGFRRVVVYDSVTCELLADDDV